MLPIDIEIGKKVEDSTDLCNRVVLKFYMQSPEKLWQTTLPCYILFNSLRKLKQTARITNIVCIGLGTLQLKDPTKTGSTVQHIVASSIAQDLERIYKANGTPLKRPIRIIAQDPTYNNLDRLALAKLPVPIEIVSDPEGFLAINESSLVFASYPTVPVKQLIADLSSEAPGGRGPAALFLNNNYTGEAHGDVNFVKYDWDAPTRHANPETGAYLRMLESYIRVLDGERRFGENFSLFVPVFEGKTAYIPGYEWFPRMEVWARTEHKL
ncbi:hypothetical protein ACET3X_009276 [Alternaria dauci]|uniref:SRR1-like domain-containing protein n=1 Tax=Alternaria dauci TaxID=48095 RepID=A0ABR3UAU4_9PLEO